MTRRVNIFGQPLAYDVGVVYVGVTPKDRSKPIEEGDDVSTATKDTAVKYVKDLTHGVEGNLSNANRFPVGGLSQELSTSSPNGTTPPLSMITNADGQFVTPFTRSGRALNHMLEEIEPVKFDVSDSDFSQNYIGDATFIKKGKSVSGEVTGHELLLDPDANVDRRALDKYVSPILMNNRFNPERKMESINGRDKKFNPEHSDEGKGSYKKHAKLGTDFSDGQLANVGPMLTLRATKELNSISREGYGADGPDGSGAKAASLLPGLAQVGAARVSTDDLQVDSVLKALIAGETDGVNVNDGEDGPRVVLAMNTSYGQMNNVLEQFSGLLPLGMVAAAIALTLVLNVAMRAILAVFLLITNASSSNSTKRDSIGRFIPGDSRYNPAFSKITFPPLPLPAKLFGLVETVNPYGDAVTEGITVFFGGKIGDKLTRILESPGFYVTFCRNVVRSAADLARGLENVGKGNPIAIAENIIGFIDVIKSSKVVAVMNMFAQIGDVSLQQAVRLARFDAEEDRESDSEIDNIEGLNAMRNRKPGSLALAWGASSTISSFLLPNSMTKAMLAGKPGALTMLLSNTSATQFGTLDNRFPAEYVEQMEDVLNAEYVPFYFHDLRTNEIASFQAFLTNLSEDYSVNHDSIEGYGRVDAIKMYRNTARKIGLSFIVAATNKDDFDIMWVKINKLTTLVYPQWSKGSLLKDSEGNHFTQPFSQIPTASPLMRVRVGDLWTSNYSKFSLARVFGLGDDAAFKLKDFNHAAENVEIASGIKAIIEKIKDNNSELPIASFWLLEPGDYEASTKDLGALGAAAGALASVASAVGIKTKSNARVSVRLRNYTRVFIVKVFNQNAYAVRIFDDENLPDHVKQSSFLVSRSHLSISDETLATMGSSEKQENSETPISLASFFSSENNAIVKAYEASKGRGLACVVESLSFDWFDGGNIMWETGIAGSRAPKMCKVTMAMAVVHDIAPGIDANGFNRAPIYSVGGPSRAMAGRNDADEGKKFDAASKKIRKSLL